MKVSQFNEIDYLFHDNLSNFSLISLFNKKRLVKLYKNLGEYKTNYLFYQQFFFEKERLERLIEQKNVKNVKNN